jgi:hypothetical protein
VYSHLSSNSARQAYEQGLSVEIVLRNLELCCDTNGSSSHDTNANTNFDGQPRGRSLRCESPPGSGNNSSVSSTMKHQRWSADSSSSPSLSPARGDHDLSSPTTTVMDGGDVPLHLTLRHHMQRRRRRLSEDDKEGGGGGEHDPDKKPYRPSLQQRNVAFHMNTSTTWTNAQLSM